MIRQFVTVQFVNTSSDIYEVNTCYKNSFNIPFRKQKVLPLGNELMLKMFLLYYCIVEDSESFWTLQCVIVFFFWCLTKYISWLMKDGITEKYAQ